MPLPATRIYVQLRPVAPGSRLDTAAGPARSSWCKGWANFLRRSGSRIGDRAGLTGGAVDAEVEGFAQFVVARERALQRTAWLLTSDWAPAEDLVQTALARSWPRWGTDQAAG